MSQNNIFYKNKLNDIPSAHPLDYRKGEVSNKVINEGVIKQKSEIESSVNGVVVREEDLDGIQFRWL
ncbi:hypothetical protein CLHOM_02080 [Clostridium homopropionicum DSM 5847]|uniref:Uncharacterized protein n=1 Tax=Clostridium homopropionicum DSM 5847 TaxID=1121318 RepID=A0A0L6ZF07_9CLOT|nr:hypothetical protein [Clostridium homopropionicum]KOA21537.1 hypothetical protein CLHOM_02080 [Clostridium homopropionicum DSM 5847]SFG06529.1 hypothetical protein SAMN04488501_10512 [Clostridium homopropionicum]